jgi:hypothetical protein
LRPVRCRKRFATGSDEHAIHGLALACVARIHVPVVKMVVILRQHSAVIELYPPVFAEALDGEDIPVIEQRAFCLSFGLRQPVARDAYPVALRNANLRRPVHLETGRHLFAPLSSLWNAA